MSLAGRLSGMGVAGVLVLAATFLIIPYEGEVLGTYADVANPNLITACYGRVDPSFSLGQEFTQDECLGQLAEDLEKFDRYLDALVDVPLNANQRAALLSFIYNVGPNAFRTSTLLLKLNSGDYEGACNELPRWVHAGGRQLPGLVARREEERKLCMTPVEPAKPNPENRPPQMISLACHRDYWRFYRPC